MKAKVQLQEFLKHVVVTPDIPFVFRLVGSPMDVDKYIHRMRVELARYRRRIRSNGKQTIPFKVLIDSIEQDEATGDNIVSLRYHLDVPGEVSDDLADIFGALSNDHPVVDYKAARGLPELPIAATPQLEDTRILGIFANDKSS